MDAEPGEPAEKTDTELVVWPDNVNSGEAQEKDDPEPEEGEPKTPDTQKPVEEAAEDDDDIMTFENNTAGTVTRAVSEAAKHIITIINNYTKKDTTVTLEDVNIDVSDNYNAAMEVRGAGDTTLKLEGDNTLRGGHFCAGLEKDDEYSTGKLTITAEDTSASLKAYGGDNSAGIGGGSYDSTSKLEIANGKIYAESGFNMGAGIGGGSGIGGNGSNITISGDKTYVEATGGGDAEAAGAGIGGGFSGRYGNVGKGSDITIEGGTVIATGGSVTSDSGGGAAGIGGGSGYAPRDDKAGNGEHIYIKGDANVTAKGGNGAAGIGGGNTNNKMGDAIDIVIEGNAKVTTEAGGDVSIGGKNGEISNDDLLSKDFTGILTRKDNTGKVMEDYSKDATPLPASEENGVVWVDADVSGWGGVRIAVPEGTPTDSVSACYLEEGALLIVDAGGSDCLLEGRVSDLRQNGIRQLCLRWNGGEQTLSTDALAAAGGEDASFRLTEVNGGLTMVLNGLTRNELLAK